MHAMGVAGATAKAVLLQAAAEEWDVPLDELVAKDSYISHQASNRSEPFASFAEKAANLNQPDLPKLKTVDEFKLMGTSQPRFNVPEKVDGTAMFSIDVSLPNMKYAAIKTSPVFGAKLKTMATDAITKLPGGAKDCKPRRSIGRYCGWLLAGQNGT